MIKNIIFDLSEVYLNGVWKFSDKLDKDFNFFKHNKYYFTELMKGNISEDYFWVKTRQELKIDESVESLKKLCRECFTVYDKNIPGIVKKLKSNYKIGLLSDHVREWMDYIEKEHKLSEIFDNCVYSYQVSDIKLGCGIMFEKVLDEMNADASETIFIDNYDKNVEKAESMGIVGIVYKNSEQLINDLRILGVKI